MWNSEPEIERIELADLIAAAVEHGALGRDGIEARQRRVGLGEAERIEDARVDQADDARAGGARRGGRAGVVGADVVDGVAGSLVSCTPRK